jgi:amidase
MLTRRHLLAAAAAQSLPAQTPELCLLPARQLAQLLKAKKLSARDLLAAHLQQIERVNPKVNAIVTLVPDLARAAAQAADDALARGKKPGLLHGLPIAHKDLVDTKGIRTTYGSPLYKDHIPQANDITVDRLQSAGAITIGKTNTPEFGAGSQTFNTVFGPTRNPYDLSKTCGGSSGGAAVALATRMLPIADGSDMGGSLRNPAAFCNITGFRPSPGRVPNPAASFGWFNLSTAGPMARNVSDLALLLAALAGPHTGAPLSLADPGASFLTPLEKSFKGTKIAWYKDLGGIPFDPAVQSLIHSQIKIFESLGCIVEQAEPDFSGADFAFKTLRAWNSAHSHAARLAANPDAYKDTLKDEIQRGLALKGPDIARAEALHTQVWRTFQSFLKNYDFFLLPTTQLPPFHVDTPYPSEIAGVKVEPYIDWMKSCWYISVTGNPAISVPAGFTPQGLPVGLQIVGRHHADFSVLQLAHAYEQATNHYRKLPPIL